MSFEIKKVYTDNPYVDEMVYYAKLMGAGTVLKQETRAHNSETMESLKNGGLYISCMENTAILEEFDTIAAEAFIAAGVILDTDMLKYDNDRSTIPPALKPKILQAQIAYFIKNYVELNPYYRMLHGLPPKVGQYDLVEDWIAPDGVSIDLSRPIHEMDNSEIMILDRYGVIDDMMESESEDGHSREYMRYLGNKKIDYYTARRAQRFDPLYIPTIDSDSIQKMYKDKLDDNKFYVLRTVYSEAFKYGSDYYDNFIAVFIVLITVIDIISRVQEFITRKEIFDIRSVQYIFQSNGIPFFEEIPLKYQISMVKNLHTFLKYKSTAKCMVDICSLFGFDNIKIFKYYLLKDHNIDITTGEYIYSDDPEEMYDLKFLKLPLDEDLNEYIRSSSNYVDYDEITESDSKWDGGLDHNEIKKAILAEQFNFTRTKYISIDTIYDIAKMSAQQSYFFNFLYDNVYLETLLQVQVPYISTTKTFEVADIFTLLTALTYIYNGVEDTIMDTQSKVLYVNGFNFKADLATLASHINSKVAYDTDIIYTNAKYGTVEFVNRSKLLEMFAWTYGVYTFTYKNGSWVLGNTNVELNDYGLKYTEPVTGRRVRTTAEGTSFDISISKGIVLDPRSTLHAQEQLQNFQIPTSSIPSFNEMMKIFINNMDVRDELIYGMRNADNKDVYDVYKKLYDSLMTVQLTLDYYKNPETGDFYRDADGVATFTEYLRNTDPVLYDVILQVKEFEDETSRNQYIATLIDSIVYVLEEYIDTDEFQALFSNLPIMSIEAVKQYIATVINFYKSYKVDFLGINSIYTFDDDNDGIIALIDKIELYRYFERPEFLELRDRIAKSLVKFDKKETLDLIERVYFDISTWKYRDGDTWVELDDKLVSLLAHMVYKSAIVLADRIYGVKLAKYSYESIILADDMRATSKFDKIDSLGMYDRLWIYEEGETFSPFMSKLRNAQAGQIIMASRSGEAVAGPQIMTSLGNEVPLIVELADYGLEHTHNYVEGMSVTFEVYPGEDIKITYNTGDLFYVNIVDRAKFLDAVRMYSINTFTWSNGEWLLTHGDGLATEKAVDDYMENTVITSRIVVKAGEVAQTVEEASDSKVLSEKATVDVMSLNTVVDDQSNI